MKLPLFQCLRDRSGDGLLIWFKSKVRRAWGLESNPFWFIKYEFKVALSPDLLIIWLSHDDNMTYVYISIAKTQNMSGSNQIMWTMLRNESKTCSRNQAKGGPGDSKLPHWRHWKLSWGWEGHDKGLGNLFIVLPKTMDLSPHPALKVIDDTISCVVCLPYF